MGKVPGNRKELNPVIVAQLWNEVKDKMAVKELCKVLDLPRSTFYRWVNTAQVSTGEIEKAVKRCVCVINSVMDTEGLQLPLEKWDLYQS